MGSEFSFMKNAKNQKFVWDDIRVFLAVAHHGTLGNAAKLLGLGIATMSRRIERLEESLGLRLFVHHQSGYKLTAEGAAILSNAEEMETTAMQLLCRCREPGEIDGTVRLATSEMLASELILPALPALQKEHTRLNLEIVTDSKVVNVHQFDADLALRLVKPERGNVTVRRLGELGFGLYSNQHYIDSVNFTSLEDLYTRGRFIGWTKLQSHLPAAKWISEKLNGRQLALQTTSLATQLAAVAAGSGIALLPHFVANRCRLICLNAPQDIKYPLWLVIHSDLSHTPRVRAVADFLTMLVHNSQEKLSQPLSGVENLPRSHDTLM
ncbi:LysR family transcriptional regulator [Serratia inhibens]|nr:LysR family transcriptional regulator [Serratia inhibens]ANS44751.1 HTH-type transcriptional regulator PgrR [Serratia inhibens PRI-2C]